MLRMNNAQNALWMSGCTMVGCNTVFFVIEAEVLLPSSGQLLKEMRFLTLLSHGTVGYRGFKGFEG